MEFQREELDEILNIFQQESLEIISSMDEKLLALEKDCNNNEIAMQLFRDAHSLKGSARMLGFENIQNIAHKIEDIISLVKENKLVITQKINDTISECLEFITMLINKTVENKEEYTSLDIEKYIERLEDIANNYKDYQKTDSVKKEISEEEKKFLDNFNKIEENIIQIIYTISDARISKDYSRINAIENYLNNILASINDINDNEILSIKYKVQNAVNSLDKFKISDNKELDFLDLNSSVSGFIELIIDYTNKNNIERQDYYEIVEKKLNNTENEKAEDKVNIEAQLPVQNIEELASVAPDFDKLDDLLSKVPLLVLNIEYFEDFYNELERLVLIEKQSSVKELLIIIKDIIKIYKERGLVLAHDVMLGIQESLEAARLRDEKTIKESIVKINIIKTMVKFQQRDKAKDTALKVNKTGEISQKELLNTITNTEIKTLRVDSIKLDNLVGQIGELIVSKIKTNEQLSLAKQISSDLADWQKNFVKMDYYIKYFDKKYLQNSYADEPYDIRKVAAYNRQLSSLSEQHTEKIGIIIKEMSNLFKQLQESENKLNTTTTEIETMVKNMRVLPLSTIFQLFPRMVHNIARDKNKKIDLSIEGADIAADKTILEEIKTPLIHIIRNSIDHGIEDVETRKLVGKNPIGKIEISASYKDSMIVIDVKDDGRGLDIEKIKAKALEKKLLTPEELNAISNEELTNLIFYPGFSTEDFVTELSGRGLGLDIVNNKINELNGRIDIFSELNKGTVVRIILPSAIATKKVFIIEEQKQLYAIETSVIKTIARINADEIFEKDNHNYYIYNGNAIAIYLLSSILNFSSDNEYQTNKYTLLIIETDNITFGIIVEKLISDQEIVHKKLAPPLYKVKHISGITTLANGEACLILNVGDIISTINSKKISGTIKNIHLGAVIRDNSKYKILVVDDSYTTRTLQKNILSNRGYTVTTASAPIDALEKTKQTKYDFVISDVQMPEMNGFEFITKLRENPDYEDTPVIIISSEPMEKYSKEIKKTKIIKYILKSSFRQDEYIKKIESILNY